MTEFTEDLKLFPFQRDGIEFLVAKKRALLADQMGLGKTVTSINALVQVYPEVGKNGVLIVVPKIALHVWEYELLRWGEYVPHVVVGSKTKRQTLWNEINADEEFRLVLTTYDVLRVDANKYPLKWGVVILDEAHRVRNRRTKAFKAVSRLRSQYFWALTGTPARKGPQDMWSILHLINRRIFRSYWKFVNTFCYVEEGPWGKEIFGARNVDNLRRVLKQYMLRRTADEVLEDMPELIPIPIPLELDDFQEDIYRELAEDSLAEMPGGNLVATPNQLSNIMRLRQMLVTPKLLEDHEDVPYGTCIEAMLSQVDELEEAHVTIFTPFSEALSFIEQALRDNGHENIFTIKGGMKSGEIAEQASLFKESRGVMLATIKAAEAYSLETCSYCFFIGFEWDFDENDQAARRLLRMTSKSTVFAYYFVHENLMDERVLEMVLTKRGNVFGQGSLRRGEYDQGLIKYLLL